MALLQVHSILKIKARKKKKREVYTAHRNTQKIFFGPWKRHERAKEKLWSH